MGKSIIRSAAAAYLWNRIGACGRRPGYPTAAEAAADAAQNAPETGEKKTVLNYIWAFMIAAGIVWAALHGNIGAVTSGLLDSAADAVSLCITMLGVVSMWTGVLKIGERSGLVDRLARRMGPVLRFLFPDLPEGHPARRSISVNMIANMLGLGWAATPAGLQAMKELAQLEEERQNSETPRAEAEARDSRTPRTEAEVWDSKTPRIRAKAHGKRRESAAPADRACSAASREMCTFLVINISSLQLIPVNMIAYRGQYGSAAPAAIVGPAFAATAASTLVAVIFCKAMNRVCR